MPLPGRAREAATFSSLLLGSVSRGRSPLRLPEQTTGSSPESKPDLVTQGTVSSIVPGHKTRRPYGRVRRYPLCFINGLARSFPRKNSGKALMGRTEDGKGRVGPSL